MEHSNALHCGKNTEKLTSRFFGTQQTEQMTKKKRNKRVVRKANKKSAELIADIIEEQKNEIPFDKFTKLFAGDWKQI